METLLHDAFHFESLVWHGPIALYLFLLGLSAGAALLGLILKRWVLPTPAWHSGFIRAIAVIAPVGILVSLAILILHLTKPLAFWKLMLHYNFSSVMAIGVMLFQLYTLVLFVWLALVFQQPLTQLLATFWQGRLHWTARLFTRVITPLNRIEGGVEILLALIAGALGVYTGFLLSALKTYPMLNNPWLPLLFLFSGVSSGVAGTLLLGVTAFRESADSPVVQWAHRFERPILFGELVILTLFFAWLLLKGGRAEAAALAAIGGGFWAGIFWFAVVGVGLVTPLTLQTMTPARIQHTLPFVITLTSASLLGVLALRYFMLYAGQLTVF